MGDWWYCLLQPVLGSFDYVILLAPARCLGAV